jgi:signal transduction histidine kinase
MTLRWRFSIFIGAVILVAVIVFSVGFLHSEKRHLEIERKKAHFTAAGHLAHACGQALVNQDDLAVLNFFKELGSSADFVEALCVDEQGNATLHSNFKKKGMKLAAANVKTPHRSTLQEVRGQTLWAYDHPVFRAGRPVGGARVVFDQQRTLNEVKNTLAGTIHRSTGLALGILGIAFLLAWSAARALTRPILAMAVGAKRVGGGDWSARVDDTAPGELGVLAREFNAMSVKLGELDHLKDQFVSAVSHDLRNPLGAINASAKMLQGDSLEPRSRDQVALIVSSVTRLSAMVSNILDIACLQEKALVFDIKPFSLLPLVNDLFRLYKPLAQQSKKTIEMDVQTDLPPLQADEEKVFRIFLNLIVNAFKFTREGDRIRISARTFSPKIVECRVSDTGRGIAPDRLPELFEPHRSRGKAAADQPGQGSGLGLSIVKILVEGNGGTIRVESAPGKGSTFIFTLPMGAHHFGDTSVSPVSNNEFKPSGRDARRPLQ